MLKTLVFQVVILQKSIKLLRKKQKKPKEISKERSSEIAYQRHAALEYSEKHRHQHRFWREASTMLLPRAHHTTRCQPLRDGDRKAVHRQTNSNQYDRENIHRRMYELRFTNEYENYVN